MRAGDTFDERYELVEILGSGGTGAVWRARDKVLGREVALKTLRADSPDVETMRARRRAEAQVAGSLAHPGIGSVYDYGETSTGPYIVMAVVPGVPLSAVLREERKLSPERVMSIVAQVATALDAAHRAGIVHRDLKPANVMLDENDRAILLDFGIARSSDHEPLTLTGTLVGTVDYISPEQTAGRSATSRSDLYSLGMLAYESLTGLKPFRRESQVATALAHLQEEAPPLPPEIPEGVRLLVERLMAKDPDHRPESAAQVAALARAALQDPSDATEALAVLAPLPRAQPAARQRSRVGRRRVVLLGAPLVLAILTFFTFQAVGDTADRTRRVVDVVGLAAAQATDRLEAQGFVVRREPLRGVKAPRGEVMDQRPAAGARLEPGSVVTLGVAAAAPRPVAPPTTTPSPTAVVTPSPTPVTGGGGGAGTGAGSGGNGSSGGGDKSSQGGPKKSGAPGKSTGRGKGRKK
ncbi:protein kinase domain-containing protein [Nocardioides piscis]|uniref:non-specific serine/threonine protein kinase n=1 Tax=Nocardioides piscis TaxID=2714938 RepID=A0A6G7YI66_9ACTN|nr:protein kinase [Nocardioides piscis]QIK76366.1 serine/threonine protein kinase [Nocardioides piscis]